ncbi:MAG: HAMP domain-containing histidine kinase [Planctomycetes bacterium]|nr:HAMP domain-containing histidine kinase [Planctomycetota bacterium]MBL7143570.1 HAMP domain-containing histidine kinase [Phycisphaerae bacterium]
MEPVSENIRLLKRAYWLVRLRWIAIVSVGAATYVSSNLLGIELQNAALYSIAILLALYNLIVLLLLNHFAKKGNEIPHVAVKKIINVQISADLLILTVLLHFSGGIENPFVFYFIFHMIIASILLSLWDSYLQATFAVLVFGLLILLEYLQRIPHYCLRGFAPTCLHRNILYILGTFFVFATASYLAVYMASYISVRLKRTERAYMQANTLLQKKDQIKDEYVLRVTHDIKSHLATIQSCLGMVVNKVVDPHDEQKVEFVDRAYTRTIKLTNFVKTLLKLTQMRLNDKLEIDVFPLRDTVHNAVAAVRTKAEDKSIILNCDVDSSVDTISGNQFSIEEVFTNLLLNAIRYTPEKGTVTIGAKNGMDCVVIEIADTGIGIPADELEDVFDEFFRASNARKFQKDGTGLGLSIAKYIVERHGGKIWIDSIEDTGTKFWITLPKGSRQFQAT